MLLEILIHNDGIAFCLPGSRQEPQPLQTDRAIDEQLAAIPTVKKTTSSVVFLVSEELLYNTSFTLPLKTPNLKEAISYQLEQLLPFELDSIYYSYKSIRKSDGYAVLLYALRRDLVESYIKQTAAAGFNIVGLYPLNQRYIVKKKSDEKWAMVFPGRFPKILCYAGDKLKDRFIGYNLPGFSDLAALCGTMKIYYVGEPPSSSYIDSAELLTENPIFKEFNLLPASFRRPDYLRKVIWGLAILNSVTLLMLGVVKEYRLLSLSGQVASAMEQIMPLVNEIKELQKKEEEYKATIDRISGMAKNPDLIIFFKNLSEKLPASSYLDQMRMDKRDGAIQVQGYTDDISELTSSLKGIGEAKLKSTSMRRNKTYFQLEITLP